MFYRLFRIFAAAALRLFFRRIEIEGLDNVPAEAPVLLVPNHSNSLVDPLLPIVALGRKVTLTAKSTLARNPLLGLLWKGLGVIYFHRAQDVAKGADLRENVHAFETCRQSLSQGAAICIFPEGISHSDLQMRNFHTGLARIAMEFVRKDGNPGGLEIEPVGLLYTGKDRFRSDVWLRFGRPLDVGKWLDAHPDADAAALTEEVRRLIEAQTLSFEDRREMVIVHYASEIIATQGGMPRPLGSVEPTVAEWFGLLARLQQGYRQLLAVRAVEVEALSERVRRHRAELKRLGIAPSEVYLPLHPARAALFLVRELELTLLGAPLAVFGILNHLIPYVAVKTLARALSKDKDQWASNVIYPSFLVFPLYELLLLAAVWMTLPTFWAVIYSAALPYTGYYALLYRDRTGSAWRRARTFFYFLFHRGTQSRLADEGRSILSAIESLGEQLEPARPGAPLAEGARG